MQGLNKAYFIGRIGRDPEVRTSPQKGVVVASFSIATSNRRKAEDGTWIDHPDWHRLTAFGATAEYLGRTAHQGDGIAVECSVRQDRWTDRQGAVHYGTRFLIDRVLWVVPKLTRTIEPSAALGVGSGTTEVPGEPSFPANVGPIRVPDADGDVTEPASEGGEEIPF